jgi:hypothetical protein
VPYETYPHDYLPPTAWSLTLCPLTRRVSTARSSCSSLTRT